MYTFNEPNLNAPRFREKKFGVLNKKLYKEFLKKYPEHDGTSYDEFKKIINTFNKNLYEGAIENRNGVELPEGLGYIFIGTCPPSKKRKNLDFKKSIKYGIATVHKNWDSDNNLMKIFFTNSKVKYNLPNKQLWAFNAVRDFKRLASERYREQWAMYIAVDSTRKISSLFEKARVREYLQSKNADVSKDYNEFKM